MLKVMNPTAHISSSVVLVTSCNFSFSQIWPKETLLVLVLVVLDLRNRF